MRAEGLRDGAGFEGVVRELEALSLCFSFSIIVAGAEGMVGDWTVGRTGASVLEARFRWKKDMVGEVWCSAVLNYDECACDTIKTSKN